MTPTNVLAVAGLLKFQYRKRYEITCDDSYWNWGYRIVRFQYRKRYEITCDMKRKWNISSIVEEVSIPQAV